MNIAITGHTNGIGKSFADYLQSRNHIIVGISKREGNNIRNISATVDKILNCDMWINNAQSGFAQSELLMSVASHWYNDRSKMIWNISTIMASDYHLPEISGLSKVQTVEYRVQKRSLEDAIKTLEASDFKPRMITIRPGAVATQPYNTAGEDSADVDAWTKTVCDFYIQCRKNQLFPKEINLGFKQMAPEL